MIRNRVGGDFCEDAFGRDSHGHASKSKETLYYSGHSSLHKTNGERCVRERSQGVRECSQAFTSVRRRSRVFVYYRICKCILANAALNPN
jgi:hypothetical protein